jgi:hypothetical protein
MIDLTTAPGRLAALVGELQRVGFHVRRTVDPGGGVVTYTLLGDVGSAPGGTKAPGPLFAAATAAASPGDHDEQRGLQAGSDDRNPPPGRGKHDGA